MALQRGLGFRAVDDSSRTAGPSRRKPGSQNSLVNTAGQKTRENTATGFCRSANFLPVTVAPKLLTNRLDGRTRNGDAHGPTVERHLPKPGYLPKHCVWGWPLLTVPTRH